MIQVHYIYCVLYFYYYYYISSTSDHQVLDSGTWGPLPYSIWMALQSSACKLSLVELKKNATDELTKVMKMQHLSDLWAHTVDTLILKTNAHSGSRVIYT